MLVLFHQRRISGTVAVQVLKLMRSRVTPSANESGTVQQHSETPGAAEKHVNRGVDSS